jgi:hypothetical protein
MKKTKKEEIKIKSYGNTIPCELLCCSHSEEINATHKRTCPLFTSEYNWPSEALSPFSGIILSPFQSI